MRPNTLEAIQQTLREQTQLFDLKKTLMSLLINIRDANEDQDLEQLGEQIEAASSIEGISALLVNQHPALLKICDLQSGKERQPTLITAIHTLSSNFNVQKPKNDSKPYDIVLALNQTDSLYALNYFRLFCELEALKKTIMTVQHSIPTESIRRTFKQIFALMRNNTQLPLSHVGHKTTAQSPYEEKFLHLFFRHQFVNTSLMMLALIASQTQYHTDKFFYGKRLTIFSNFFEMFELKNVQSPPSSAASWLWQLYLLLGTSSDTAQWETEFFSRLILDYYKQSFSNDQESITYITKGLEDFVKKYVAEAYSIQDENFHNYYSTSYPYNQRDRWSYNRFSYIGVLIPFCYMQTEQCTQIRKIHDGLCGNTILIQLKRALLRQCLYLQSPLSGIDFLSSKISDAVDEARLTTILRSAMELRSHDTYAARSLKQVLLISQYLGRPLTPMEEKNLRIKNAADSEKDQGSLGNNPCNLYSSLCSLTDQSNFYLNSLRDARCYPSYNTEERSNFITIQTALLHFKLIVLGKIRDTNTQASFDGDRSIAQALATLLREIYIAKGGGADAKDRTVFITQIFGSWDKPKNLFGDDGIVPVLEKRCTEGHLLRFAWANTSKAAATLSVCRELLDAYQRLTRAVDPKNIREMQHPQC